MFPAKEIKYIIPGQGADRRKALLTHKTWCDYFKIDSIKNNTGFCHFQFILSKHVVVANVKRQPQFTLPCGWLAQIAPGFSSSSSFFSSVALMSLHSFIFTGSIKRAVVLLGSHEKHNSQLCC